MEYVTTSTLLTWMTFIPLAGVGVILLLTALRSLLGLEPRSFLSAFATDPRLRREKTQGRFVYYSADATVCSGQRECRGMRKATGRQPTPSEAIAVLVEKIKHPALSHEALSRQLRKQRVLVEAEIIQNFFLSHGLTVKKTPHSI